MVRVCKEGDGPPWLNWIFRVGGDLMLFYGLCSCIYVGAQACGTIVSQLPAGVSSWWESFFLVMFGVPYVAVLVALWALVFRYVYPLLADGNQQSHIFGFVRVNYSAILKVCSWVGFFWALVYGGYEVLCWAAVRGMDLFWSVGSAVAAVVVSSGLFCLALVLGRRLKRK